MKDLSITRPGKARLTNPTKSSFYFYNWVLLIGVSILLAAPSLAPAETLWKIGLENNSGSEFTGNSNPSSYSVPSDWNTLTTWPEWKSGTGEEALETRINYDLPLIPAGGAEFTLKTSQASAMVPEIAVFSNKKLMGILQIIGAQIPNWQTDTRYYGNTYKVYIPKEFLNAGSNTLTLKKLSATYALGTQNYNYMKVSWDYLRLDALSSAPLEPVHSRTIYLGSVYGSFTIDQSTADLDPKVWEWTGIAYSGNPIRASFWSDLPGNVLSKRQEYLEKAKDYNMSVVLDFLTDQNTAKNSSNYLGADGELVPEKKKALDTAFQDWASNIQYYEIENEPCMGFDNGDYEVSKAIAAYITKIKPANVKLTAPGYAYGGNAGKPVNWDTDVSKRIELESSCDATGGHSYGNSYYQDNHGNFMATIDTYGSGSPKTITNGFPKEMVITECGVNDSSHQDFDNLGVSHDNLYASMYDKNLRAHIGFADRILNFSTFGEQDAPFAMLDGSRTDSSTWKAHLFSKATTSDSKLKIFRRLACAYATHGKPLPYTYVNSDDIDNQLVYFRAVDTSFLPPMPGNGHQSKKILLNFVNFDTVAGHEMKVAVTFPTGGTYTGIKFTGADSYTDAKSDVSVQATPEASLDVTLSPGEAVQYILER